MSSCSVYGAAGDGAAPRTSDVHPLTAYAKCKVLVERDVKPLASDNFSPTFLRNATAFGASPRMRFDLVVNDLAGHAWTEKVIRMDSDGSPWRPFVHILDISQAIDLRRSTRRATSSTTRSSTSASNAQNYQIREIARDHLADVPGLRADDRRQHRRQPQLPGELRQDHTSACRASRRYDVARGAEELPRRLPGRRHDERALRVPRAHADQADQAPARDAPDRRPVLLDRPARPSIATRPATFEALRPAEHSTAPSLMSMEPRSATTAGCSPGSGDEDEFRRARHRRPERPDERVATTPPRHDPRPALAGRAVRRVEAAPLHRAARCSTWRVDLRPGLADLRALAGRHADGRRPATSSSCRPAAPTATRRSRTTRRSATRSRTPTCRAPSAASAGTIPRSASTGRSPSRHRLRQGRVLAGLRAGGALVIVVDCARSSAVPPRATRSGSASSAPGSPVAGSLLQVLTAYPGMDLVAVCNRTIESAERAYRDAGADDVVRVSTARRARRGRSPPAGTRSPTTRPRLRGRPAIEVIVEATGEIEFGAGVALPAIENGKHLVLVNAELDSTLGPILKTYADRAGVVLTDTDGDQPGVLMNLVARSRCSASGRSSPATSRACSTTAARPRRREAFAEAVFQRPKMITSFADGTKIAAEMAIARPTRLGFGVTVRGHGGPALRRGSRRRRASSTSTRCSSGRSSTTSSARSRASASSCSALRGDPLVRRYMKIYKMGDGPVYTFYRPFHLSPLETPHDRPRRAPRGRSR